MSSLFFIFKQTFFNIATWQSHANCTILFIFSIYHPKYIFVGIKLAEGMNPIWPAVSLRDWLPERIHFPKITWRHGLLDPLLLFLRRLEMENKCTIRSHVMFCEHQTRLNGSWISRNKFLVCFRLVSVSSKAL